MKVLQINAVYGHGSTGVIAKEILDEVVSSGGEAYVASVEPENHTDLNRLSGYITIGNKLDRNVHALQSRVFGEQGFYSKLETRKLIKKIQKIDPDIIHLHNLHNNYINLEILFGFIREYKMYTVITLHDCWFFTGKCCHFLYDDCEKWMTGCDHCPRQKKELPSYFVDRSARDYEKKKKLIGSNPYVHVVGCSAWLTDCARKSILKSRVEHTIYNGIDLSVFKPTDRGMKKTIGLEGKNIVLGMANKWLSEENSSTFDYIVPRLNKNTVLILIGCTNEQIANIAGENILLVGFVYDRTQLAEYYSMADVFVNVTKVDSFPTVNIEALGCGTPVITYNSGGSAETVDMSTGAVVVYGDYVNLMNQIDSFLAIGKTKYKDNCVRRANKYYDKKNQFREYIELYEHILGSTL
ncbi:MAG: glycosyltransferase [Hespellia sp.]|nr:glycosyltransferase [Hespellia sp.]